VNNQKLYGLWSGEGDHGDFWGGEAMIKKIVLIVIIVVLGLFVWLVFRTDEVTIPSGLISSYKSYQSEGSWSGFVNACKERMQDYAKRIKELEAQRGEIKERYTPLLKSLDDQMAEKRSQISTIDSEIRLYNNNIQLISENYDALISDYTTKAEEVKERLDKCDIEIGEWNEMNELFTKTLRYKLLDTLIPHINKSIQFFINKLDQNYKVEFDQEFKSHIYIDVFDKEINYTNLSTGQKKTLDMAIIFGILKNIISNVDCNIILLDELFSNMDVETRNVMLSVLKESFDEDKTVFVINHAEMNDDFFSHKIKVSLFNKKVVGKKEENSAIVKASKYEQIF